VPWTILRFALFLAAIPTRHNNVSVLISPTTICFFFVCKTSRRGNTMAASIAQHVNAAQSPLDSQPGQQAMPNGPRTGVSGNQPTPTSKQRRSDRPTPRRPSPPNSPSNKMSTPSAASYKPNSIAKSANAPVWLPNHPREMISLILRSLWIPSCRSFFRINTKISGFLSIA
jgi:hypothetical protein